MLDLYSQPYDPERRVVCFDVTSTQLLADITPPIPAKPGRPMRQDYKYLRAGTRNLFLTCEPLAGWHWFPAFAGMTGGGDLDLRERLGLAE